MDERCFRPLLCTVKAELGRGQPGLMRLITRMMPGDDVILHSLIEANNLAQPYELAESNESKFGNLYCIYTHLPVILDHLRLYNFTCTFKALGLL